MNWKELDGYLSNLRTAESPSFNRFVFTSACTKWCSILREHFSVRQPDRCLSLCLHAWRSPGGRLARWAAEDEEGEEWASEGSTGGFPACCSAMQQPQGGGKKWTARARYWHLQERRKWERIWMQVMGWWTGLNIAMQHCYNRNSCHYVVFYLCMIFSSTESSGRAYFCIKIPF